MKGSGGVAPNVTQRTGSDMDEPKTSMGIAPITIKGREYRVGRILRFVVGLVAVFHAVIWGPYDDLKVFGAKLVVGILFVDPTLLKDATTFWKSRSG